MAPTNLLEGRSTSANEIRRPIARYPALTGDTPHTIFILVDLEITPVKVTQGQISVRILKIRSMFHITNNHLSRTIKEIYAIFTTRKT